MSITPVDLDSAALVARHAANQSALAWGAIDWLAARPNYQPDITDLGRIYGHLLAARQHQAALADWLADALLEIDRARGKGE